MARGVSQGTHLPGKLIHCCVALVLLTSLLVFLPSRQAPTRDATVESEDCMQWDVVIAKLVFLAARTCWTVLIANPGSVSPR